MDQRLSQLQSWLEQELPRFEQFDAANWQLEAVSGDASFRRYFRAHSQGASWIAVDAPPEKEDSKPFITVAESLAAHGVDVPEVFSADLTQGFMLLGDFGDELYLPHLSADSVGTLYGAALDTLLSMQACPEQSLRPLPEYDLPLLEREVGLFKEWFLEKLLGFSLDETETRMVKFLFGYVIDAALEQPKVFVHRDYHSRNLMYREGQSPGVIDFQDAVRGPVTYDLVSLLRDCYISWPDDQVYGWVEGYRQALIARGQMMPDQQHFQRWFDLMGAQRHLKAIGIFARLNIRDEKPGYLADIPRTLNYLITVAAKTEELKPVAGWLVAKVIPAMRETPYFDSSVLDNWETA